MNSYVSSLGGQQKKEYVLGKNIIRGVGGNQGTPHWKQRKKLLACPEEAAGGAIIENKDRNPVIKKYISDRGGGTFKNGSKA